MKKILIPSVLVAVAIAGCSSGSQATSTVTSTALAVTKTATKTATKNELVPVTTTAHHYETVTSEAIETVEVTTTEVDAESIGLWASCKQAMLNAEGMLADEVEVAKKMTDAVGELNKGNAVKANEILLDGTDHQDHIKGNLDFTYKVLREACLDGEPTDFGDGYTPYKGP